MYDIHDDVIGCIYTFFLSCSGWCGSSRLEASSQAPKAHGFDFRSGHVSQLWVRILGRVPRGGNQSITSPFLSPSFFLPL